jgi:hypothetical protein
VGHYERVLGYTIRYLLARDLRVVVLRGYSVALAGYSRVLRYTIRYLLARDLRVVDAHDGALREQRLAHLAAACDGMATVPRGTVGGHASE